MIRYFPILFIKDNNLLWRNILFSSPNLIIKGIESRKSLKQRCHFSSLWLSPITMINIKQIQLVQIFERLGRNYKEALSTLIDGVYRYVYSWISTSLYFIAEWLSMRKYFSFIFFSLVVLYGSLIIAWSLIKSFGMIV